MSCPIYRGPPPFVSDSKVSGISPGRHIIDGKVSGVLARLPDFTPKPTREVETDRIMLVVLEQSPPSPLRGGGGGEGASPRRRTRFFPPGPFSPQPPGGGGKGWGFVGCLKGGPPPPPPGGGGGGRGQAHGRTTYFSADSIFHRKSYRNSHRTFAIRRKRLAPARHHPCSENRKEPARTNRETQGSNTFHTT